MRDLDFPCDLGGPCGCDAIPLTAAVYLGTCGKTYQYNTIGISMRQSYTIFTLPLHIWLSNNIILLFKLIIISEDSQNVLVDCEAQMGLEFAFVPAHLHLLEVLAQH